MYQRKTVNITLQCSGIKPTYVTTRHTVHLLAQRANKCTASQLSSTSDMLSALEGDFHVNAHVHVAPLFFHSKWCFYRDDFSPLPDHPGIPAAQTQPRKFSWSWIPAARFAQRLRRHRTAGKFCTFFYEPWNRSVYFDGNHPRNDALMEETGTTVAFSANQSVSQSINQWNNHSIRWPIQ